ncbi:acetyl/propionyl/methylcrotonyl-CoA carboxylase subunit alpha [Parvularcula lutaonensis]|uniref:Biotin carboxylase N-terminal domain-containing protein n=1 Tax=Parvularcula lutaonensis TaxID=491923 RepID=A0ABV7MAJ0_9PROT|nr:biotin carboxylase N-terminal domain-containing protein [Parvularcula lutaonensis]GGY36124.1 3-methylcrotonyl-CoA carboxylase subunit alpha [Parvularcula lutaonensis]
MFKKLLIANRGEIACRVIKTARRLGVKTVAVYSDADKHALHVRMADEAYHLGPPAASESYLLSGKIIEVAKSCGAEAIHPGYGFLSENAGFSRACEEAGIAFVGPKPHTIEAMGSKAKAKELMGKAGVPMLQGYQGEDQSLATFKAEAERIGYPVLLKAAAGGGGKGMRIVERPEDLEGELESAKREAKSAFGDDRFIVEKFLAAPRHVEVQVFGDSHGNVVHLFERDCSVQRRYQKVIEEAPAPNIPDATRAALHKAAVDAARAVDYVGAGTVEFLYDGKDGVYFMEMNTRLQVEHPVTEEITGIDLVEWQLRAAAGEPVPLRQDEIQQRGHAVEARLYAEDPEENYLPQIGRLTRFDFGELSGESGAPLRLDTGVAPGDAITPFYDPMIAKVITYAETREDAVASLANALATADIGGLVTNRDFLVRILRHPEFREAPPTTKFLSEHDLATGENDISDAALIAAAIVAASDGGDPEDALGFRLNAAKALAMTLVRNRKPVDVTVRKDGRDWTASFDGEDVPVEVAMAGESFTVISGESSKDVEWGWSDGHAVFLTAGGETLRVPLFDPFVEAGAADAEAAALSSPMPATVTGVMVREGDTVSAGQPLVTLEAMKMETVIKAPHDGTISAVHFAKGESAPKGAQLAEMATG